MSENTTTEVTATPVAVKAATKKAAKKTAPKKVVKKVAKKATKKTTAAKAERKPRDPNKLGKAQLRVLKALAKAGSPITGAKLAEKAEIHPTMLGQAVGYRDPEINARPVHAGNLLNRKFAKVEMHDIDGRDTVVYSITAAGRKALEASK